MNKNENESENEDRISLSFTPALTSQSFLILTFLFSFCSYRIPI